MDQNKNLLISVLLATIILVSWQYFFDKPTKQHTIPQQVTSTSTNTPSIHSDNTENKQLTKGEILNSTQRIKIVSPKLNGSISLVGARIDDVSLPEYKETTNPDSPDITLLSPAKTPNAYFAEFGWLSNDKIEMPNSKTLWSADKDMLTPNSKVTLNWVNGQGILFTIELFLDEEFMLSIKQTVNNQSPTPISFYNYGLISRIEQNTKKFFISHEGSIGVFNNILTELSYEDLKKDKKSTYKDNGSGSWFGISDKYWLTAIVPDFTKSFDSNFSYNKVNDQDRFQVDFLSQQQNLQPGDKSTYATHFFMGAKVLSTLDKYQSYFKLDLFDRAIDFGWFYFITKPLFIALKFFYDLLGNFGLSILLVTIIVKLAMYPMASKSFISMNKMKQLQPEFTRIKELYANDRMQQNRAIMELYKKEKVNPMSGCLPILIQIPIFFSLYKVLFVTIEMRQAPFYGWIHDLSAPDPTSLFNLFGLIPWDPPSFLMIGAWPIIMAVTMYIQQILNPQPSDPVQAQMMRLLPLLFLFMFSSFPAGLVIYWAWSNTLSILQQYSLQRTLRR